MCSSAGRAVRFGSRWSDDLEEDPPLRRLWFWVTTFHLPEGGGQSLSCQGSNFSITYRWHKHYTQRKPWQGLLLPSLVEPYYEAQVFTLPNTANKEYTYQRRSLFRQGREMKPWCFIWVQGLPLPPVPWAGEMLPTSPGTRGPAVSPSECSPH